MQPKQPRAVYFLGMASLMIGGVLLAVNALKTIFYLSLHKTLLSATARPGVVLRDASTAATDGIPGYAVFQLFDFIASWVLALLLVASGEALVRMWPRGRKTALVYSIGSLVHKAILALYLVAVVLPFGKFEDSTPLAVAAVVPVLGALFPALMLFLITRPTVVAAFAQLPRVDKPETAPAALTPEAVATPAPPAEQPEHTPPSDSTTQPA